MEALAILKRLKKRYPYLRVGQIIANALPSILKSDPYYITDEDLTFGLQNLETIIEMSKKGNIDHM